MTSETTMVHEASSLCIRGNQGKLFTLYGHVYYETNPNEMNTLDNDGGVNQGKGQRNVVNIFFIVPINI